MTDLLQLHDAVQQAQERMDEAAAEFHAAVAQKLRDGGSATRIARELGVTRGRVYQWRDRASS